MDALERLYNEYLLDYAADSNCSIYDMDMQLTKDRIEEILLQGFVDYKDIPFLKSILPEIENIVIRNELEDFIQSME